MIIKFRFWLIFMVLLVLKLTDTVDWSWWWITLPLWLPFLIVVLLFSLGGAIAISAFKELIEEEQRKWR